GHSAIRPGTPPRDPISNGKRGSVTLRGTLACSIIACPAHRKFGRPRVAIMQAVLFLSVTISAYSPTADDEVLRWNDITLQTIRAEQTPPPLAARHLAMVHVAIYDTVNAIEGTHRPFRVAVETSRRVNKELAVAAAAHRVLTE